MKSVAGLNFSCNQQRYDLHHQPPLYANVLKGPEGYIVMPTDQGGGIMNGDKWNFAIEARGRGRLEWRPAASTLALPGVTREAARVSYTIRCADQSEMIFISPSTILHEGCGLNQVFDIEVYDKPSLFFWDSTIAGRLAYQHESFAFSRFISRVRLQVNGTVVYNDAMKIKKGSNKTAMSTFQAQNCWGTGLAVGQGAESRLRRFVDTFCQGFEVSINQLAHQVFVLRVLGNRHIATYTGFRQSLGGF